MFAPLSIRGSIVATAMALCGLGIPLTASAHHGWSSYDAGQLLVISGVIQDASYEYPHGELTVDDGEALWTVVLSPPLRMRNRGLEPELLTPGVEVTFEGYRHRSVPEEIRAERITVDGATVELR